MISLSFFTSTDMWLFLEFLHRGSLIPWIFRVLLTSYAIAVPYEDTILINFPRKSNTTRVERTYLPPEHSTTFLPEVIDNRLRIAPLFESVVLPRVPKLELQAPAKNHLYSQFNYYSDQQSRQNLQSVPEVGVRITTMSCQNSGDELYFRASMIPSKHLEIPVIENASPDTCKIVKVKEEYQIQFDKSQFWNCGVTECSSDAGNFYCLTLRFPVISGLRLKEDFQMTLQCKTQEKTASHTKRINVKTLDTAARTASTIAKGGFKNAFETDVGLYRKTYGSDDIFDTRIQSGGTVVLGEEILLRALVRDGDGWRYSRISEVNVHYVEQKQRKKIMNSLSILDTNGCLNPEVREICSREQYRVSSLESYLIFRAFMFNNMKESDEMILSVKVTGCLDGFDCVVNCPAGHIRRSRRSFSHHNQTMDSQDDISFRVVLPHPMENSTNYDMHLIIPYALSALALVTVASLLCTIRVVRRRRIAEF